MTPDRQTLDDLRIDRNSARKSKLPLVLVLLCLLAAIVAAAAFWWLNRPKTASVRTLLVQAPAANGNRTLLNASGYVEARREATVSAKITGKVVEVLVEEGMRVEAGQILARLDASNVEKNLHLAEARVESTRKGMDETKASLEQAERELRRFRELAAGNIATQSDLDRADAEVKTLRARLGRQAAEVAVADSEVALWKQQVEDTIIRAPFAGIVTSKDAQPGEMISPVSAGGGFTRTGICTIVDMNSLEIEVDVNESFINRVKAGQPVEATLDSYPEWQIPAKVIAIVPTADRQKATVKVRVGFEKLDPRILPDMSVKVAFQAANGTNGTPQTAPGIILPKAAVHEQNGTPIVWLVKDGRVERRAVSVASTRDSEVTVSAGLQGGEKVVVEGAENLKDGAPVREAKR